MKSLQRDWGRKVTERTNHLARSFGHCSTTSKANERTNENDTHVVIEPRLLIVNFDDSFSYRDASRPPPPPSPLHVLVDLKEKEKRNHNCKNNSSPLIRDIFSTTK